MNGIELTPEQEKEAQAIADIVMAAMRVEAVNIGRLLASKGNAELFGQTEFDVRGRLLRLGTRAYEAALEERKKGGTKDPA